MLASYYLVLAGVTLCLVTYTVFVGSLNIHYGRQIKKLNTQKENLLQMKQNLVQELTAETTSQQIEDYALTNGFVPMSEVIYPKPTPSHE